MKKLKLHYIFNSIAIIILLISFSQFILFFHTKESVNSASFQSNISYVDNITNNISDRIKKSTHNNIYSGLKQNSKLREILEKNLQLLDIKRYKYIYVVDKKTPNDDKFRFLLDGSKSIADKSDFEESYEPLNAKEWNVVYKTKKPHYFKHKGMQSLWMTYLKPIIVDNRVKAVVVIDFSLQEHNTIMNILSQLDKTFNITLLFYIVIFIVIIVFSYIDRRREKEKDDALKQVKHFNETLKDRVKEEVEKNRKKDQQLIQQSRLAQMGEMISMIAHQWRQPLAAISATSIAINLKAQLNKLDNKEAMQLADKISDYSQHLSHTIDDFRDFFKSNKEKRETTYEEILQSVLNIIQTAIENKIIQIIKELDSDVVFHTYPNELKQVVLNLIKNAEDVLLEKELENPTIIIQTKDNILTVSDNAGGVPEEIIEKIFDPYFSTKTEKNGTGLGLYMSKTIIEEHCGGKLSVSNSDVGAVFKIELDEKNNI